MHTSHNKKKNTAAEYLALKLNNSNNMQYAIVYMPSPYDNWELIQQTHASLSEGLTAMPVPFVMSQRAQNLGTMSSARCWTDR